MSSDPHAALRDAVLTTALNGPGATEPSLRQGAAEGVGVPSELQPLIDKIHNHAYRVTDDDVASLQMQYTDDQLFEIIVSAALGASRRRLLAGLRALDTA